MIQFYCKNDNNVKIYFIVINKKKLLLFINGKLENLI